MQKPELWKPGKCVLCEMEVGEEVMRKVEESMAISLMDAIKETRLLVTKAILEADSAIYLGLMKEQE